MYFVLPHHLVKTIVVVALRVTNCVMNLANVSTTCAKINDDYSSESGMLISILIVQAEVTVLRSNAHICILVFFYLFLLLIIINK